MTEYKDIILVADCHAENVEFRRFILAWRVEWTVSYHEFKRLDKHQITSTNSQTRTKRQNSKFQTEMVDVWRRHQTCPPASL